MTAKSALYVAFFLPSLQGGGAERVTVNLANGLANRGVKVDLVVAQASGEYHHQVLPEIRLIDLNHKRVLTALPGLMRYVRGNQPDALISVMDHANLVAAWAKMLTRTKTRLIATIHKDHLGYLREAPTFKDRLILRAFRYFQRSIDATVAVSQGAAESAARTAEIPVERIKVIYNVVVTAELSEKMMAAIDHPWLVKHEQPVILGVGRLNRFKDFGTLICAFALVRQQRPMRLLILGEGEERAGLEMLVRELNLQADVQMPGFVANPFAYMARADLFVLSSQSEALPTVLIEAMACGCPVVSTDCPSGPAEILENGRYGDLVPVGDAAAMAAAVLKSLDVPREAEGLKLRANDFSVDKITADYLALIETIIQ